MRIPAAFVTCVLLGYSTALAAAPAAYECKIIYTCDGQGTVTPRAPTKAGDDLPIVRRQLCERNAADIDGTATLLLSDRAPGSTAVLSLLAGEFTLSVFHADKGHVSLAGHLQKTDTYSNMDKGQPLPPEEDKALKKNNTPHVLVNLTEDDDGTNMTLVGMSQKGVMIIELGCEEIN